MHHEPRFLLAGDSGLVVEFGSQVSPRINAKVRQLLVYLEEFPLNDIKEAVPTYRSLLVYYDPSDCSLDKLQSELRKAVARSAAIQLRAARMLAVPVKYGGEYGPDLEDVAVHNKTTVEDIVRVHSNTDYLVYMIGFTPGFPYLGELPKSIACPRLATPRVRVPAGSVGIAGTLTGIYPVDSPGGWRLIGRTPLKLFDERASPPSLMQAGDYVRFRSVTEPEYLRIADDVKSHNYQLEIQSS